MDSIVYVMESMVPVPQGPECDCDGCGIGCQASFACNLLYEEK